MVHIISDSSTLYSIKEANEIGLSIVPLNITIDNKSYKDYEEISSYELLNMIKEHKIPKTSQPSLGEKIELYNKYCEKDKVIDIAMSSGLSGTYQTALIAKNSCTNPDNVTVIDSFTLCGPHRELVNKALEMAKEGKNSDEIIKYIENAKRNEISFLIPTNFEFLVRGGRVNGVSAILGGLLKLMPIMKKADEGKGLDKFSICRTSSKVGHVIVEEMKKEGIDSSYIFYVTHADNENLANKLKTILESEFVGATIKVYPLSPSFITQGGPGCVAVQAIKI